MLTRVLVTILRAVSDCCPVQVKSMPQMKAGKSKNGCKRVRGPGFGRNMLKRDEAADLCGVRIRYACVSSSSRRAEAAPAES